MHFWKNIKNGKNQASNFFYYVERFFADKNSGTSEASGTGTRVQAKPTIIFLNFGSERSERAANTTDLPLQNSILLGFTKTAIPAAINFRAKREKRGIGFLGVKKTGGESF